MYIKRMNTRLIIVTAVALCVSTAQTTQLEDCRLYQVTADNPSPIIEVSGNHTDTHISLGLLFDSSNATITILNEVPDSLDGNDTTNLLDITGGDSTNSCQMKVNKVNGTLEGSCFKGKEIPLKCSQDEGMDTIVLRRRGSLLVAYIDGDNTDLKVLTISASNKDKFQVTSGTFVHTVFNCPSNCFQFNNAIIHSIYELSLSAKQITPVGDWNSTSVIKVLHGEDLRNSTSFDFDYAQDKTQENNKGLVLSIDYPQSGIQENGGGLGKLYNVLSQYKPNSNSTFSLSVSGSLIGSEDPILIGVVPSLDTYFRFENMETILWTTCPNDHFSETPTTDSMTTSSVVGIVKSVIEQITTDDQNTEDYELESEVHITITETDEPPTVFPVVTTTKRFIEEVSCKDTREPKCTLTMESGGSCNCAEAKANGWCDDLKNHPDIEKNCEKTCGLCPDQSGDLGASGDSIVATKPPKTSSGNIFVYVMIGIVVVMLLVLVIWLTCKKRRASGQMDLEGQSHTMSLTESAEKTNENNTDSEKIAKKGKEVKNEGAKNNAFQEQKEVKEKTKVNDEKVNTEDGNKAAEENSPLIGENDCKNTDDISPTDNDSDHNKGKNIGDKVDDKEDTNGKINHEDKSPNEDSENNTKTEKENENASKGIVDSLENEKSME